MVPLLLTLTITCLNIAATALGPMKAGKLHSFTLFEN